MNKVYLLIGGNVGDRKRNLELACREMEGKIGPINRSSSVYETAPWGNQSQDPFLNQVLEVFTQLKAEELMQTALGIEKSMGRMRVGLNQPRTIDIDILYFNEDILQQEGLTIPHPRIYKRKFVLVPMQELNASYMDPLHQKSISQLLQECEDELEVRKYDGM